MKLKDMIAAVRGYQTVQAELDSVKLRYEETMGEKMALESQCDELRSAGWEQQYELQRLQGENTALTAVLREFCPALETTEQLKRFYDAVSPTLDADGFKLYWAAEKLTGINLYNEFPYEDNFGYFEEADGHALLSYLTASRFNAVEWEIAPGTSYESATLLDLDKTTPEYKAFEKKLYTEALKKLGFEKMLPPEQAAVKEKSMGRRNAHER